MLHLVDSSVGTQSLAAPESSAKTFHMMFQMETPSTQHWSGAFRGYYTLAAMADIVSAYRKNGEILKVWLLEDAMSVGDARSIKAAFEALEMPCEDHCNVVFQVCPMLFAACHGLERAVGKLRRANTFARQPDQIVNGLSAMACAVMGGWRPDIAVQLTMTMPSGGTLMAIMSLLDQNPDDPDLYQRECREAVAQIFESELEILRNA